MSLTHFGLRLCMTLSYLPILLANTSATAEIVSTGVGVVRGTLVTSRQVQIYQLVEVASQPATDVSGKFKILPLDSRAFARATSQALLQMVLSLEAQNFNAVQIDEADLSAAQGKVLAQLASLSVWKGLQVQPKELSLALRTHLLAKKFTKFRSDSSVLPVTDSEALKYFNDNKIKFGTLPFDNFKENIKSFLSKSQVEQRMQDWYEVLLVKYQVKNLIAEI